MPELSDPVDQVWSRGVYTRASDNPYLKRAVSVLSVTSIFGAEQVSVGFKCFNAIQLFVPPFSYFVKNVSMIDNACGLTQPTTIVKSG